MLPSTRTRPVFASSGTVIVSVVPSLLADPVRVTVPVAPVSSAAVNCTSVLLVKPWPVSAIVCPTFAEACVVFAAVPACAEAVMPVNSTGGCAAKR